MTVLYIIIAVLVVLIIFLAFSLLITRERIIRMENLLHYDNHRNSKINHTSESLEDVSWDLRRIDRSIRDMAERGSCVEINRKCCNFSENCNHEITSTLKEILKHQKETNNKLGQLEESFSETKHPEFDMSVCCNSLSNLEENVSRLVQMKRRTETINLNGVRIPKWIKILAFGVVVVIGLGCTSAVALVLLKLKVF